MVYNNNPDYCHFQYALHVIKYGLKILCDANWGHMNVSKPRSNTPLVGKSLQFLQSISGLLALPSGDPILWVCLHHKHTAQNSYEAEVHSINEATKLALQLKLLFRDLNLPTKSAAPLYYDNQGAVQWSWKKLCA